LLVSIVFEFAFTYTIFSDISCNFPFPAVMATPTPGIESFVVSTSGNDVTSAAAAFVIVTIQGFDCGTSPPSFAAAVW
jgi:hypothetical protein